MPKLDVNEAQRLAQLPAHCLTRQYPNKLGQLLNDESHLKTPKELHPAFYGCYDWHSSVHGHWTMVALLKKHPNMPEAADLRAKLAASLTAEHIQKELAYFHMKGNASYERTYGWAWLLKLSEELHTWDDPLGKELAANLQPLADYIAQSYIDFLPKLAYPIRVGEHTNTAFGMTFAWDYAQTMKHEPLLAVLRESAMRFYANDVNCPLGWEPSGFDFLSPCMEEADIMRRVLPAGDYRVWLGKFLPQLKSPNFAWAPGQIIDRTDAKLIHLDGLNFSRAWVLQGIANTLPEYGHLRHTAAEHLNHSLPTIVDDNYGGTHWLGSFAVYALMQGEN